MANALSTNLRGVPGPAFALALCALAATLAGCVGNPTKAEPSEGVRAVARAASVRLQSGLYHGTIGARHVDMTLSFDADSSDSLHGSYVEQDGASAGARVLLAGEIEDDQLSMEESRNGVDVSGHFDATIDGSGFSGQWSDAQGAQLAEIQFKRIR